MKTISVIQNENSIEKSHQNVFLWYGFKNTKKIQSIQKLLETNAFEMRSEILKLLETTNNDIGKILRNQNLTTEIDRLVFHMSLLSEHSIHKSPYLVDALKILLLKKTIIKGKFKKLLYSGDNVILARTLKVFCDELKIKYIFESKKSQIYNFFTYNKLKLKDLKNQNLGRSLFVLLKTIIVNAWVFSQVKNSYDHDNNSVFIMSYFSNFRIKELNFHSNFWGKMPKLVKLNKLKLNWNHLFIKNQKNNKNRIGTILKKNLNKNKNEKHSIIDAYFEWKDYFRIIKVWISCQINYRLLYRQIHIHFKTNKNYWFWFLCNKDIYSSFLGGILITNLFYIISFKNCFKDKNISKGMLLFENHGWEKAFTYYWYKNNNGYLLGVTHYPPRFWDIRILNNFDQNYFGDKIIPDKISIFGEDSLKFFEMQKRYIQTNFR